MSASITKVGMTPCHPGEFIREEILNELRLPVARAAAILGVRPATLSDLVNGKAALSPEMALRIEKAFGISMDTLLRMQAWHDSHAMRQRAAEIDVSLPEPLSSSNETEPEPHRRYTRSSGPPAPRRARPARRSRTMRKARPSVRRSHPGRGAWRRAAAAVMMSA